MNEKNNPYAIPGCSITPEQVIHIWEKFYKMKKERVTWYDKNPDISIPRHVLCYCLKRYAQVEQSWIAGCIMRDRITVKNSLKVVEGLVGNKNYSTQLNALFAILDEASGKINEKYRITVELNREDLKVLMPDIDEFKQNHWSLEALWSLYNERRFTGKPLKRPQGRTGITGKSTLT